MIKCTQLSRYALRAYRSNAGESREYQRLHLGKWRIERRFRLKYWLQKNNIDRLR